MDKWNLWMWWICWCSNRSIFFFYYSLSLLFLFFQIFFLLLIFLSFSLIGKTYLHSEFILSICFPCLIIGRTHSILENEVISSSSSSSENSIFSFLQLGNEGCLLCLLISSCNCCLPLSFSPIVFCFTFLQRVHIMNQFNIEGDFFELLKSCFCPFAIFQHYRFIKDFQHKKLNHYSASSMKRSLITSSNKDLTNSDTESLK